MKPFFLIGFMCSGKTTLGRALAEATRLRFIDLDDEICRLTGMSVKEIFQKKGEDEFRRIESETLANLSQMEDVIVACGGGTPCRPGAMDLMNSKGMTVRLVPGRRRLITRLMDGRAKRPLIAAVSTEKEMIELIDRMEAEREEHYSKAASIFDSTFLENPEEIAETVNKFIARFIKPVTN